MRSGVRVFDRLIVEADSLIFIIEVPAEEVAEYETVDSISTERREYIVPVGCQHKWDRLLMERFG